MNFEEILLFFTVRCLYNEFFFHRVTIGSLRNDHRDSNENGKKQNNNFARASRFLYISLPSLHDYDVKLPNFTSLSRTGTQDNDFLFLFLNFDTVF